MDVKELGIRLITQRNWPEEGWTTLVLVKALDSGPGDQTYMHGFFTGLLIAQNVDVVTPDISTIEVHMPHDAVTEVINKAVKGLVKRGSDETNSHRT
jgi:hypothetical protein